MVRWSFVVAAAAASIVPTVSATAQIGACQVGARVIDRQSRAGVVTEARASDCRVKLDDGTMHFYLAWMLSPAPAGKPATTANPGSPDAGSTGTPSGVASASRGTSGLTPGNYDCWAAGGVAGTMRLVIKSGSVYADRGGKTGTYSFDAATDKIVFKSGSWAGYFGKKFGPAKIGISSRQGNYYGTTCDLK